MLVVSIPAAALAQHGTSGNAPLSTSAPREATQFDFLIGQWELVATPKVGGLAAKIHGSPKLPGVWKAWKAFDGWGIEDELRLMDGSGNPRLLAHAMRMYDGAAKKWSATTLDVYRSRFQASSAEWANNEMIIVSKGTDAEGKSTTTRIRFYNIKPNTFSWIQDRSEDDGKTWNEGTLKIEAKRIAATAPR